MSEILHIITDPAHLAAEGIFRAAELVVEITLAAVWVRRHDRKKHVNCEEHHDG